MSCSHPTLVLFYANWCGYCSEFKPTWEKIKTTLKGSSPKIHVRQYEADENRDAFENEEIKSYPTIRLYCEKKLIEEYSGDRSEASVLKFVKKHTKK